MTDAELAHSLLQEAKAKGLIVGYDTPDEKDIAFYRFGNKNETTPYDRHVVVSKNMMMPNVVAHELGHAMDWQGIEDSPVRNSWVRGTNGLAHYAPKATLLAGTVAALLGANKTALAAIGGAGALAALPQLIRELKASKNGYSILREKGKDRLEAAKTFGGIRGYVTPMLLGFLPLGARMAFDYFNKK